MDILVYAINMELDGEKYYKEQAKLNRDNSLYGVFMGLAEDECDHARILEDKARGSLYRLSAPVRPSVKNVFSGLSDSKDNPCSPDQIDVYKAALDKEKQSIELYKKLLGESAGDKELYEYLIEQEEEHCEILEEIINIASRPNEWVESAEFGKREEY